MLKNFVVFMLCFAIGMMIGCLVFLPSDGLSDTDKDVLVLTKDNTLSLANVIDSESVSEVVSKARALDTLSHSREKPLILVLNTPGGNIQDGLEMFEVLRGLHRRVDTLTLFAASMGFQTVQNLGTRYILSDGVMMSHRAAGQIAGSFGGQSPSQMDNRYALWLERMFELDTITVTRTSGKQTYQSYTHQYADELWLTGSQSVEKGYSDKVVIARCDASLSGSSTHTVNFLGLALNYELDDCPLATGPKNIRVKGLVNLNNEQVKWIIESFKSNYSSLNNKIWK